MVFMGSAKYPSENQYDQYVNSHGGACNAFTEGEYTVYQFDITGEHMSKALDMVRIRAKSCCDVLTHADAMQCWLYTYT